jgi:hypothetical protein
MFKLCPPKLSLTTEAAAKVVAEEGFIVMEKGIGYRVLNEI